MIFKEEYVSESLHISEYLLNVYSSDIAVITIGSVLRKWEWYAKMCAQVHFAVLLQKGNIRN